MTKKDVDNVASLAKLKFTSEQTKKLAKELDQIVRYVEKLNELDTKDIQPTSHIADVKTLLREDKIQKGLTQEEALANAPKSKQGYFSVPKVIG